MRLMLTFGQQLCFLSHLFYERWLSACSSGLNYPRRTQCAPKLKLPNSKLYIQPGLLASRVRGMSRAERPFCILTCPVTCMIMVELIVRNPIDRQDFGLLIARLSLFMSAGEGGEE